MIIQISRLFWKLQCPIVEFNDPIPAILFCIDIYIVEADYFFCSTILPTTIDYLSESDPASESASEFIYITSSIFFNREI